MSGPENLSYLIPRDPSIKCWNDRVKLQAPLTSNLVTIALDDPDKNINEKVKVHLRIKNCGLTLNLYKITNNTVEVEPPMNSITYKNLMKNVGQLINKFHFTSILDQNASQKKVFEECVLGNLKRFISGENNSLFAYGTTNSGKTFTMQGSVEKPGVIPRALQFVFDSLKNNLEAPCQYQPSRYNEVRFLDDEQFKKELAHKHLILNLDLAKYERNLDLNCKSHRAEATNYTFSDSDVDHDFSFREVENNPAETEYEASSDRYSIWVSMIEIYNETFYDLLEIRDEKLLTHKLTLAEDEGGNVFIKNLRYVNVSNGHEALKIFRFGRANLHVAPTALNINSSRSHSICIITLAKFSNQENSPLAFINRFSFCDLAGIERVKKALNVEHRLMESKSINSSLSIFTKCLKIVKENQASQEKKMVPYRESKLTRLFRDAMLGKERLSIIVNVTPEQCMFDETMNVLKLSAVAQKIELMKVSSTRKILKPLRKTALSKPIAHSNNPNKTLWNASTVVDVTSDENSGELQQLLNLIDRLKVELDEERRCKENIEKEIREELTTKFLEIMRKHDNTCRNRFENETKRIEEMYERKQKRLVEFYERKRANVKRMKMEEEDECLDAENQMKKIRQENEFLKSEIVLLRNRIKALMNDNASLQVACKRLEFDCARKTES